MFSTEHHRCSRPNGGAAPQGRPPWGGRRRAASPLRGDATSRAREGRAASPSYTTCSEGLGYAQGVAQRTHARVQPIGLGTEPCRAGVRAVPPTPQHARSGSDPRRLSGQAATRSVARLASQRRAAAGPAACPGALDAAYRVGHASGIRRLGAARPTPRQTRVARAGVASGARPDLAGVRRAGVRSAHAQRVWCGARQRLPWPRASARAGHWHAHVVGPRRSRSERRAARASETGS